MIRNWLQEIERQKDKNFRIIDLTEKVCPPTEDVKKFVAEQLITHLISPTWIKKTFSCKDRDQLKNYLKDRVLPSPTAPFYPRKSMWGEVLTALILERIRALIIPVKKLRYKECKDKAMRGKADCIAASLKDNKLNIYFSETKTRSHFKLTEEREIAKVAHDALKGNMNPVPEIIDYIARRLENDDEYSLADFFSEAVLDPTIYERHFEIFLIFDKSQWNEEVIACLREQTLSLPNLIVNIVLIDNLDVLIDSTYNLATEQGEKIVYE